jgi:Putative zinc-finger
VNLECAETRERLPEFSLGVIDGAERADVLVHLAQCSACRSVATEYGATADALSELTGESEPPQGFESRVLDRLHNERLARPRRGGWKALAVAAALVAAIVVASVAAVRLVDASSSSHKPSLEAAQVIGGGGMHAGKAFLTDGSDPYLFVALNYGMPTGTYGIMTVAADGHTARIGSISIVHGAGSWVGDAHVPAGALAWVRIVRPDGHTLCSAKFSEQ